VCILDDGAERSGASDLGGRTSCGAGGGAEFASRYFQPGHYLETDTLSADGMPPRDAAFLRWTLSDSAAGVLVEDRPAARGLSLAIDWISLRSFADRVAPA
jgi:3-oxoacyl-[acyl-carrier-protein] synthase-3